MGPLSVAVGACAAFVDWLTPLPLNESIVYSIPLVMAGLTRNRWLLWGLLVALLCMTFAVYSEQIGPDRFALTEPFFQNRVFVAVTMVITAAVLHLWTRSLDVLDERDRRLEEQNARLLEYQQQIREQSDALDRRRREAEAASERKTMLLASASHDIRTPLAAIDLTAQAIGRSAMNPELAARIPLLAQQIRVNSTSVEQLVADILDLSTFELAHVELHLSEFALTDLIRQHCQNLQPLAEAKKLALIVEPIADAILMRADRVKLGRVLANLVMNAIKYTESGSVWVAAGRGNGGSVWMRIRDSGIGIATEDSARIFDEFEQLQQQTAHRPGWGLGLSICHRLVELMGGTIKVDSSVNIGSTFTVTLPPTCVVSGP